MNDFRHRNGSKLRFPAVATTAITATQAQPAQSWSMPVNRPPTVKSSWLPGKDRSERRQTLIVYLLVIGLFTAILGLGLLGLSVARPIFIVGCMFVGWRAWRVNPGLHTEVSIALFVFAPLMRRVVDLHAGYDTAGIMLVGPLLALGMFIGELRKIIVRRTRNFSIYAPYGIMLICLIYGWSLSAFQNRFVPASAELIKSVIPMLYALYLTQRGGDCEEIIQGAARMFLVISPIIGIYGVLQYMSPPEWDRYWMIYSQMVSIGLPEPGQIRVFSTMNSPATFAMFAACGLLIFSFCRRGWLPFLLVLPIAIALLLTAVRTAWITVMISVVFCGLFNATRGRAVVLTLCLLGSATVALLLTPFADTISDRLASLGGDPAQDGSGHARLQEYLYVYSNLDQYLFGTGFGNTEPDLKLEHIDGQLVASAVSMGIFIGNIYVISVIWAAGQALFRIKSNEQPLRLVIGGIVLSYVLVMPLLVVTSGEISFLFWLFVGTLPTFSRASISGRPQTNTGTLSLPHYPAPQRQAQLRVRVAAPLNVASQA